MEIKFLGTSAATPTSDRNLPSFVIRLDNGNILIFDTGEDVQRRFEAAKLKFNVPTIIFISHMHGDHIIGLPGLLFNFHLNNRSSPLTIIGPQGIASYLITQYQLIGLQAKTYDLEVYEVLIPKNNIENYSFEIIHYSKFLTPQYTRDYVQKEDSLLLENEEFIIKGYWMEHSVPVLGFRFEQTPRNGKFNPIRAEEVGVKEKYLWKKLQNGDSVKLTNGVEIDPIKEGIVTEKRPGVIISYTGDTSLCDNVKKLAQDAHYLICESTYSKEDEQLAIEKKHLSCTQAAELASLCNVQNLILTHFSSRYKDLEQLKVEANLIFPNTIIAKDLMSISITK